MGATLITGVNGFIGSNLAYYLQKKKIKIVGIGRKKKKYKFDYIKKDLSNLDNVPHDLENIIHLAAESPSKKNLRTLFKLNVNSCENLIKIIKKKNIKKLIFCSSISVYEGSNKKILLENDKIKHNLSPYAQSKVICEKIIYKKLVNKKKLTIIILRLPAVLGFNCKKSRYFKIKKNIIENKNINIYNFKDITNGIISIDRLINFIYILLKSKKKKFKIINVASSHPIVFFKIIKELANSMNKKLYYKAIDSGSAKIISISKAIKNGFKPEKTLKAIRKFGKLKI